MSALQHNPVTTQLARFWRLAEMRLLFLALLVSVVAVTSVGFFTDRAEQAMNNQATQLMGGDLVIQSTRPISEEYLEEAASRGLETAQVISFPSMVSHGEVFKLAQIKAVSADYPLHGDVETSTSVIASDRQSTEITPLSSLQAAEAWAEPRLFVALGIKTADSVQLGHSTVRLTREIRNMPDQATNAFQFAPVMLIPLAGLEATGLLTPASRANYSVLFAGEQTAVRGFVRWLKPKLTNAERIRMLEDGLPAVQQALQRGQRFLKMAALLAVILAGAGIALSSYSLTRRETAPVAVLKTLGASRRNIMRRYLGQLVLIASLAATFGALLGYFIQYLLAISLRDFVSGELPGPSGWPVGVGFATAWIMALGFAAPQLAALVKVSPMQILQGMRDKAAVPYLASFVAITIGVLLLMWLQTRDLKLSLFLLGGVVLAIALFWLLAMGLVRGMKTLGQRMRLPKADQRMIMLVVVFGTGLFSLLLLTALRTDLLNRWQASLPADAPNHFLINIQPQDVDPIREFLAEYDIETPLYPMILGRLTAINGKPVSPDDYESNRAQRLMIREFNLSASAELPEGNLVSAGKWFDKPQSAGFSVEEGIASTLELGMGDSLTFDVAGQKLSQKITSLRKVQWDSMKPNFFVISSPELFRDKPRTFITSIHIDKSQRHLLTELLQRHPGITEIDISAIMLQVRDLINKAAFAVQTIFLFTLIAGLVVLFSALQSQKAERRKEIAILKSLGAGRNYLRRNLLIEFVLIGALAGFLAGALAVVASNVAAYLLFELQPVINLLLIVAGMVIGALLVGAAGYLNVRSLLAVPPVSLFR